MFFPSNKKSLVKANTITFGENEQSWRAINQSITDVKSGIVKLKDIFVKSSAVVGPCIIKGEVGP